MKNSLLRGIMPSVADLRRTFSLKVVFPLCQLLVFMSLLAWSQQALGQTIVGFDVSTLPGGANNYGPSPLTPTVISPNVSVTGLTRASGVGNSGTAATKAWGGTGWDASTSTGGIAGNAYVAFGLKVDPGYVLSLNAINPFSYRRPATGATMGLIQYRINSGDYQDITRVSFPVTGTTGATLSAIDLSSITALQNLPSISTVTFRIVPYGASAANGPWYVFDVVGSSAPDFAVTGTVSACPTITATLNGTTTICAGNSTNLTATITGGTGPYSLTISNGAVSAPVNNYTSGAAIPVSPNVTRTYTITAATDANACPVTINGGGATVTVKQAPTPASAGTSQTITTGQTATLAANAPTIGTGMWSVTSGPSTVSSQFSSTNSPTATFTPAGGVGAYVLTWTISNAPCTPSSSNVTITVAPPTCGTLTVPGDYSTIQAAINAACAGALIQVAAGTYTEQITITKSLSIVGAGVGNTTITAPAGALAVGGPTESGYTKQNIVEINGNSAVTIKGITIQGTIDGTTYTCNTDAFGIYVYDNAKLVLTDAAIKDTRLTDPGLFGCQVGFGLGVGISGSPGSATLTNVTFSGYQKGGLLVRGAGSNLLASNISVTGIGSTTATGQNGIQVSDGADATITNSSITNNSYVTPTGSTFYTASGIITYNPGTVSISGSTFTGNDVGLDAEGTGTTNVTNNAFSQSSYASIYTDQMMTLNSSGNTFDKSVTNNNKAGTIYSGIQIAIDDATVNDVLTAGAGTFAEDIYIDKAVTLNGANTGIDPNTGTRVPETILVPATSGSTLVYLADGLAGVTIDGFTVDGNNPLLTGTNINGSDVDASTGISSFSSVVNNVQIKNNIVQNFANYGIILDPDNSGGAPATGGHAITHNKIDNIGNGTGIGVLLQNNAYAVVTNNVITRIRTGVQTGNFYRVAPTGSTPGISTNTISAQRVGIFHNLQYQAATPFTVASNVLSVDATGASFNVIPRAGLLLTSLAVPTTVSSNTVGSGFLNGVEAWNDQGSVILSGGTLQGNTAGIWLTNRDSFGDAAGKLTVSGVSIINSPVGIRAFDDPGVSAGIGVSLTVTGNTQITGSGAFTAVAISGSDASANITGNSSSFVGNGSGTGIDVNGGTASVTADRITNFATGVNVSNGGQLTNAANNFITGNGTGVAYAADASATQGPVNNNDLSGNTNKAITNGLTSTTIGATCNWYGTTNVDGQAASLFTGAVTYSPYLNSGTDNDNNSANGFQPMSGACVSNQPPVASTIANQTATVGQAYSFTVPAFSDPENQTLTYTANINPANGLTFDPATRVISGIPTATGVSNVTVVATDPGSMSASQTFTITTSAPTCGTLTVPDNYPTIQAAINAACPGALIQVAAGTYTEQLTIAKSLSIVGAGLNTIVQAPNSLTAGILNASHRNIIEINNGAAVTITGINVNGPVATSNGCSDLLFGININSGAGLNLSNASVTNIYLTPTSLGGCQSGIGIRAGFNALGSPGSLTATNVTVTGYQKAGIIIDGTGSNGSITNAVVTGTGTTSVIAQNGIQISRGATGSVQSSTITGNNYANVNDPDTQATGLLGFSNGTVTASNNFFSGNNIGVYAGTPGPLTATNNSFSNNDYASIYTEGANSFAGSGNTFDKSVTNNNKPGTVYSLIQVAIDDATAGDVLTAAAGTFAEDIYVDKAVTLNGANVGIDPNTGSRVPETILVPATSGSTLVYLADGLAGVTIDGFTVDGNNPLLTGTNINGSDVDASTGISSFSSVVNNVQIKNNIVQNFANYGIILDPDNSGGAPATGGHAITHNKIDNIGNGTGIGVLLQNNAYAVVTNNVITRIRTGVQTGNFYRVAPTGSTPGIATNTISAQRVGIFHNLQYQAATPFTVANNTLSVDATGASFNVIPRAGLLLTSLAVPTTVSSNTVGSGFLNGVEAWNNQGAVVVSGGTLQGNTAGIWLTNRDSFGDAAGKLTVSGVSIINSPVGIRAFDDPGVSAGIGVSLTVTGNTQITGSGAFTAVAISGSDASANITGNASSFVGNGSGVGVNVNGGTASVTANRITNFATGINVSNGGQLTSAANNFITGNTDGIVYAADAGTTQGVVTINDLSGNTDKAIINGLASTTIDANCNYFGAPTATTNPTYVTRNVSTTQVLANNTDEDTSAPGFQNTSCFTPPTAPVLTATPPANPQGGSYNASYCIGENPTVTSNYTTGVNSFTVQSLSDGSTTVTTGNSVTINQGAGTYFVYATNTQNGYTSPVSATTTIQVQPNVTSFTSSKAAYCVGETVSLTALGCNVATASQPNLYFTRLRALDGSNNPNQGTANLASGVDSYTYTQFATATTRSYTITAECVNGGTGNVCSVTELAITVNPLPTSFSVTGGGAYCAGGTGVPVGLSGSESGVSYQLYNGNTTVGSPVAGTGSAFDFPLVTAAGTYSVLATNTATSCQTAMTGSATVSIIPTAAAPVLTASAPANNVNSPNVSYCIGENPTVTSDYTTGVNSFTVQSLSDGSTTVTMGNSVTINQGAGTYFVYSTNTQSNGCTSPVSATTTIRIQPNVTSFTANKTTYCVGETVSLTALGCNVAASPQSPLYFVRLRALDGSNNPNQGTVNLAYGVDSYTYTPGFAPATTTSYTITAECVNGGTGSVCTVRELTLTANPVPTATLVSSNSLNCSVTSTTLTATGGQTYAFAGPGIVSQDPASGTAVANMGGLYSVTVTSTGGCTSMTTTTVASDTAVPTATLMVSGTLTCNQTSVTLTAGGGVSYVFSGTGIVSQDVSGTAVANMAGVYSVTATAANGCTDTKTRRVFKDTDKPTATLTASNSGTLTCNQTSLTLTASVSGGTAPFTYAFSADATQVGSTNTATVSTAGLYSVTVTGSNGCSDVANVRVYRDAGKPTATLTASGSGTLTCNQTSLTLTASATGGTAPYTYLFSPDATTISANEATVTTAGLYSVTAIGANGCFDVASVRVYRDNSKPTATLTASNSGTLTCNQASLTLTASATDGMTPYTYAFSADATQVGSTNMATVTTAGLYSVTVTGSNGCSDVANVRVYRDAGKPTATLTVNGSGTLTCNQTSLTLTASATPGTSYTYSFSPDATPISATEATVTTAGLYSVTAIGANGCSDVANVRVYRDASKPTASLTASNSGTLTCNQTSLTLTASVSGGTAPYTYAFSADATQVGSTNQATVSTAGLYSVTVTGSNGCSDVANVRVYRDAGKPTASLTASGSGTLTCNQTSLTLTASATGGTTPYTYLFSPDATPISATEATVTTAGLYSVTAIGANGCFDVASVRVYRDAGKPTAALTASGSGTLTCNQTSLTLTASATGGTAPFTYAFSADATQVGSTNMATVSTAGLYSVRVTGANGCSDVANVRVYRDNSKPTATLTASGSGTLTCDQTSLTLTASATDGMTPYTYAFSADATQVGSTNMATVTTAGVYSVTVTGANGCSDVANVRVYRDRSQPTASLVASGTLNCNQTTVTLTAGTGAGYSYAFSSGATQIGTSNQATVTTAGLYSVTVTGSNGCSSFTSVNVMAEPLPTLSGATQVAAVCPGSPATVNLTGLPENASLTVNYTINGVAQPPASVTTSNSSMGWAPSDPIPFQTRPLTAADNGTTLTITSIAFVSSGCSQTFNTGFALQVNPTPAATLSASGTLTCAQTSVTLTAASGAGYTYVFSSGATQIGTSNQATVTTAGPYSVTITSGNGCTAVAMTTVSSSTSLVTPDFATRGNQNIPDGQTNVTVVQNTAAVSFNATNCSGTLNWSGNNQSGTGVLNAPTSVTGVFVYQATCTVGSCVSNPASVTLTVTPANTAPMVTPNANQTATVGVAFSYQVNAFTDAETPGNLTYSASISPANGLSFDPVTRVISGTPTATGVSNVVVTATDPGSLSASTSFTITVNPAPVVTQLTVLQRDPDNNQPSPNTIKPYLELQNDGSSPIPYSELTVRYYLTLENPAPLQFQINYAQLGSDKVHLTYVPLNPARQGATGYIEYSFDGSAGSLGAMSNSGPIQNSVNKQDYSAFNQGDDYSYMNNGNFTPNPRITAYRNGVLIYGVEPGPLTGGNTPLSLMASASPTMILTTGSTTLSATASGGMGPYSYSFTGPGTITPNGNTASVSNLPAGVQTFTVRVSDASQPTSQSISTMVSVTVSSPAPSNTPPTATANSNQTATVGVAFSYQVNAFTDAETPNSLTYSASIAPANGFTFNPATRVIQGQPISAGVSSVTITATDPGGLSASTVFTITVSPAVVTPTALSLTASASPTMILTTGSTTLSATVSGGTQPYSYVFTGPGTITPNGNTATVSNLPAGVQTFTVMVSDASQPTSQSISTMVSVTVSSPAPNNTPPTATANNNQTATVGVGFAYTVNAFGDAETPGSLTYSASISPTNGLSFDPATRVISGTPTAAGVSNVVVTATDPGGLSASTSFSITVSPAPVSGTTQLTVLQRDPDNNQPSPNTIKPYLELQNDGSSPIPYSELTVRYYLTLENPAPLQFQINYAQLGSDKVHLTYVPLNPARQGATGYIEYSFDGSAGSLGAMSNSGPIQNSVNKQDYSAFNQADDYSYMNNGNFTPNPRITAYRNGVLVYGVEPPAGVRLGAEGADEPLEVRVLGNPVRGSEVAVDVRGAVGQSLRLRVTDLSGHLVSEQAVERAGAVEHQRLPVSEQPAGLLFIQVSTPTQTKTVKVLKVD